MDNTVEPPVGPPPASIGRTHLSKQHFDNPHDGTKLRRNSALAAAAILFLISLVIAVVVSKRANKGSEREESVPFDSVFRGTYSISKVEYFDEFQLTVTQMEHRKTGMPILAIVPDGENHDHDDHHDATFAISIKTIPSNNHGTAHVLERAILDGSTNYPVKDPINQLRRGSLQVHLDSATLKDRTIFVASSRDRNDFQNLVNVYLDAIFHPNVVEQQEEGSWIFRQEGWRLEVDNDDNLLFNGNAINEAKGSQVSPSKILSDSIYSILFPDTPIQYDANGTLEEIPNLSHDEMIEFYNAHYRPSNAKGYCYGPIDFVNDCMSQISNVISSLDEKTTTTSSSTNAAATNNNSDNGNQDEPLLLELQPLNGIEIQRRKIHYPTPCESGDSRVSFSWILNHDNMNEKTELAWHVITELLVGSPTSVMSRIILQNNLGTNVIGWLNTDMQQWVLTIGIGGIATVQEKLVTETIVNERLVALVQEGFHQSDLDAAFAKVANQLRHYVNCDHVPPGVKIFQQIMSKWNYELDPTTPFKYLQYLSKLQEEINESGPDFFIDLIVKHLIDNNHKIVLELTPSDTMEMELDMAERDVLDQLEASLSLEEKIAILAESTELLEIQSTKDSPEDLAKIHTTSVDDLPTSGYEVPTSVIWDAHDSGVTVLEHIVEESHGVVQVDFAIDISGIGFDDVILLPLLARMLVESRTARLSETAVSHHIDTYTGGLSVVPVIEDIVTKSTDNTFHVPGGTHLISKLVVRASTLPGADGLDVFNIIHEVLFETEFDNQAKIQHLIRAMIDELEDDIQVNGYFYTTSWIDARLSLPGFVREYWQGVTLLKGLRKMRDVAENDWESLRNTLTDMIMTIRSGHRSGMVLGLTGDHDAIEHIVPSAQTFLGALLPPPSGSLPFVDFGVEDHPWVQDAQVAMGQFLKAQSTSTAFVVPARVDHVGKGGYLFDINEHISGSSAVVLNFISGFYLFDKLRFERGAFEASAILELDAGAVVYQSDRDPKILDTLDIFQGGGTFIREMLENDDNELPIEAMASIIGTIGQIDGQSRQVGPLGFRSLVNYLKRQSPDHRQVWRNEILQTSKQDFLNMADKLDAWVMPTIAVVASADIVDRTPATGLNFTLVEKAGDEC